MYFLSKSITGNTAKGNPRVTLKPILSSALSVASSASQSTNSEDLGIFKRKF